MNKERSSMTEKRSVLELKGILPKSESNEMLSSIKKLRRASAKRLNSAAGTTNHNH